MMPLLKRGLAVSRHPHARRLSLTFLVCSSVLHPSDNAAAQNVKSTFAKSVDFKQYRKYAWGSNYLLTQQSKNDQERINMAIVDSINRNLQAAGFVENDENPDFIIAYEAGGLPKADVGAQPDLYSTDMVDYTWGNLGGISSDVWVYSLAKLKITVTDTVTKTNVWQATASKKIRDPIKFKNNLKESVDKFIRKTMKNFPPKN